MEIISKGFSVSKSMRIKIVARDFKLTDAIEAKVLKKMKSIDKYMKGKKDVQVTLSTEPLGKKIEVVIEMKNNTLKSEVTTEDLYKSIDVVSNNLKHQLSELSKSLERKDRTNRHSIRYMEYDSRVETNEKESKIVKRKTVSAKPMYEDEAMLQMEALNHRSFIFINAEMLKPCMLYKRDDGDYGMIELL